MNKDEWINYKEKQILYKGKIALRKTEIKREQLILTFKSYKIKIRWKDWMQ